MKDRLKTEINRISNKVAKVLRESELTYGYMICILEMLKTDILLNSGMVEINGNPLTPIKNK